MNEIISVQNLRKTYFVRQKSPGLAGSFRSLFHSEVKEIKAVNDISFTVNEGEILAFIGPNGAGKSTTIKMMTGILFPTSGEISVLGMNPQQKRQQLAFKIGTVFGQKPQLWYHLPPQDTYDLFAKIYELDHSDYVKRLNYLVESFQVGDLLKTPVRKLSLGQRMRCEIVASFLHRPQIIFLDEPTIGLDVIAKKQIRELIKKLNKEEGVTIFLTSHDAGDVETLAERTIVINFGEVVFDGLTDELKKRYLKKKIIELVTEESTKSFKFQGGKIVERGEFNLKIELSTDKDSIEKLLDYTVKRFSIQDINIYDPSMEEIIAEIYQEQKT